MPSKCDILPKWFPSMYPSNYVAFYIYVCIRERFKNILTIKSHFLNESILVI